MILTLNYFRRIFVACKTCVNKEQGRRPEFLVLVNKSKSFKYKFLFLTTMTDLCISVRYPPKATTKELNVCKASFSDTNVLEKILIAKLY